MTSPNRTDQQRVEHARRVLAEASGDMLTADWGTLYWIAEQVPQLLDVIDHLTAMSEPVATIGEEVHGHDNGIPVRTLTGENWPVAPDGFRSCVQCGVASNGAFCGEQCERNYRGSEYRGWYPR